VQKIWIYQRFSKGRAKVDWLNQHGKNLHVDRVVDLDMPLPEVLDNADDLFYVSLDCDLVLAYLGHPDLIYALAKRCASQKVPVVSSGRPLAANGLRTPPTCCSLPKDPVLGAYAEQFGAPTLDVKVENGQLVGCQVLRGAPCGATWKAIQKLLQVPGGDCLEDLCSRFGLEVQLHCQADPAAWDPLCGKSPVHHAGKVHAESLKKALGLRP
jgi:hypothetical protein